MKFNKTFIAFVLAAVLMVSKALPVKPNDAIATVIRAWVPPAAQSIAVDQGRGRSLTKAIDARRHGGSRHRGRELEERRHGSGSRHNSHVRRNIDARQHSSGSRHQRDLDPRRHGSEGGARGRGNSREGRGRSRIQRELTTRRHGSSSRGRGRSRGREAQR